MYSLLSDQADLEVPFLRCHLLFQVILGKKSRFSLINFKKIEFYQLLQEFRPFHQNLCRLYLLGRQQVRKGQQQFLVVFLVDNNLGCLLFHQWVLYNDLPVFYIASDNCEGLITLNIHPFLLGLLYLL